MSGIYSITIPGKFTGYLDGTSVAQGQWTGDEGERELHAALRAGVTRKRGRGQSTTITTDNLGAVDLLLSHAEGCIDANLHGGDDHAERYAAIKVAEQCRKALA
jgi:hypothetical protein